MSIASSRCSCAISSIAHSARPPLLNSLIICNKEDKRVALVMKVTGKKVTFALARDDAIKQTAGTMLAGGNCRCPVCGQTTQVRDLRQAGKDGNLGERLVCVIVDTPDGKDYRLPDTKDFHAVEQAGDLAAAINRPAEPILPEITLLSEDEDRIANSTGIRVHQYGFKTWGSTSALHSRL